MSVILETNINETKEFYETVNIIPGILMAVFTLVCTIIFHFLSVACNNRLLVLIALFPLLFCAEVINRYEERSAHTWLDATRTAVKKGFITADLYNFHKYFKELEKFRDMPKSRQWENISRYGRKKDFYVLVFGEGARKSNHSIYGYPKETSPLLAKRRGMTIIDGVYAPAPQTSASISRMLTLNDKSTVDYSYNAIDLMNSMGLTTHWISNQGYIGFYDTRVTLLAKPSNDQYFLNKGDFTESGFDNVVLKPLEKIISEKSNPDGEFIVIHLIGSHPNFCKRSPTQFFKVPELEELGNIKNCYDDSIRYTDFILNEIMLRLEKTNSKLIYISDHGLTRLNRTPYFFYGLDDLVSRGAFEVPLIFWDSQSIKKSVKIQRTYYARNFIHTLANWVGIKSDILDNSLSVINDEYREGTCNDYSMTSSNETITFSSKEMMEKCKFYDFVEK
ncbi:phosphoethanolamine transferase [Psychromonas sp. MB-3u-54]|uniref:phosphoethanolamine transferase n=1 Tax=Psychromonas sp. MB-3u-54 TaxID=2058319 RepID=UPI001E571C29|nr:phosphoethanolamine transferase [Psychromonas sp. MB-3u-54]